MTDSKFNKKTMLAMHEININELTVAFNRHVVLYDINIIIPEGDFLVIVGPNGGGKTTLLKCLAGLLPLAVNSIIKYGDLSIEQAQKRGWIGYVPQNYGRNSDCFPATVQETVRMGLVGRLTNPSGSVHIVNHMLQLMDIIFLRNNRLDEISGGQLQRVMVARALAGLPKVLLMDEPTSGVDKLASARIYKLVAELNANLGITVVMVSHDLDNALKYAKNVVCINHKLCFHGPKDNFAMEHLNWRHLQDYMHPQKNNTDDGCYEAKE